MGRLRRLLSTLGLKSPPLVSLGPTRSSINGVEEALQFSANALRSLNAGQSARLTELFSLSLEQHSSGMNRLSPTATHCTAKQTDYICRAG
ncbi:hypothetical protein PoB_006167000 [Plakobranchus ocellatus]|uniref:Uncharacterized protein n=1 Tax=Plakobranchus ocellatus TaxID=259542 RepID=A0AAV4CTN3_9GAST|nr:hypothetical protein PoB_006167000 [Plakobranchus ocellatus]